MFWGVTPHDILQPWFVINMSNFVILYETLVNSFEGLLDCSLYDFLLFCFCNACFDMLVIPHDFVG